MYKIHFTRLAEDDLLEIIQYINDVLKSPVTAKNIFRLIEEQINTLKDRPLRYPLVNDEYLKSKGIRALQVKNYQVFYKVNENEKSVGIIRVLFARRNWITLLHSKNSNN